MARLILVLEVEPIETGTVFRQWPLHCTLVPWFHYEGGIITIQKELETFFSAQQPLWLVGAEEAMFGPSRDVMVNKLVSSNELLQLHNKTLQKLQELGAVFSAEHYVGNGYQPHVTQHGGRKLRKGQRHLSRAVYLVESVDERTKQRKVVSRLELGG